MILPEGTRSRTGELGESKKGAFWLARNLDLSILPITIINTRNILLPELQHLRRGVLRHYGHLHVVLLLELRKDLREQPRLLEALGGSEGHCAGTAPGQRKQTGE